MRENIQRCLTDSVETALKLADGFVEIALMQEKTEIMLFSERFACNDCGSAYRKSSHVYFPLIILLVLVLNVQA